MFTPTQRLHFSVYLLFRIQLRHPLCPHSGWNCIQWAELFCHWLHCDLNTCLLVYLPPLSHSYLWPWHSQMFCNTHTYTHEAILLKNSKHPNAFPLPKKQSSIRFLAPDYMILYKRKWLRLHYLVDKILSYQCWISGKMWSLLMVMCTDLHTCMVICAMFVVTSFTGKLIFTCPWAVYLTLKLACRKLLIIVVRVALFYAFGNFRSVVFPVVAI